MLYSSGWDGGVRRWDIAAEKQLDLPKGIHATGVVAASPDGRTLAYEDDSGTIRVVDAANGKERRVLKLPGTTFSQLAFSPDSRRLAGGGSTDKNVQVAVWDLASGEVVHRWDWPKGPDPHSTVESLCFAPGGNRLAAAVFRQSLASVWDLTTGKRIAQLTHSEIYGLSFSPDGKTLGHSRLGFDRPFLGRGDWKMSTPSQRRAAGSLPPAIIECIRSAMRRRAG